MSLPRKRKRKRRRRRSGSTTCSRIAYACAYAYAYVGHRGAASCSTTSSRNVRSGAPRWRGARARRRGVAATGQQAHRADRARHAIDHLGHCRRCRRCAARGASVRPCRRHARRAPGPVRRRTRSAAHRTRSSRGPRDAHAATETAVGTPQSHSSWPSAAAALPSTRAPPRPRPSSCRPRRRHRRSRTPAPIKRARPAATGRSRFL